MSKTYDIAIIGAGPAGLAAAAEAAKFGASVILIEREARIGGILKQCVHDGFGVIRFKEKYTGPEYAEIFVDMVKKTDADIRTETFVTDIIKPQNSAAASVSAKNNATQNASAGKRNFVLKAVSKNGLESIEAKAIILATGCRERTARQIGIHGTKPAGVMTAGTAQYFINIMGLMPGKRVVILGSGDIGLIMARRLTLEGSKVLGVYEVRGEPSGLARNVQQCLNDYGIPLHLNHTVTRCLGEPKLTAVEVAQVEGFTPIAGTEQVVPCDTLILSVGLIPENEIAEKLGVIIDPATKGPVCGDNMMTSVPGVFCCGNAYKVYDLVDHASDNAELAAKGAAEYINKRDPA